MLLLRNLCIATYLCGLVNAFVTPNAATRVTRQVTILNAASRRRVLEQSSACLLGLLPQASSASSSLSDSLQAIQQARKQMEIIPHLIKEEKWDSVRAILITPPLADCWAKTSRPLLKNYADQVGDSGGDELAAIELKEDLISHLRYLDMAVYNNVFNPINTMGENGATKALIKSYYEDPINEYKASIEALDSLIKLADPS
ncbi:hypothetical protein FisN_15Hh132 [Fistulifera solaris]|uniref:Uncharacterized protein n=1 Tax=Fistulifera solaris TaxID=1519565 RepID=A0A1Z5K9M6_FISSO|nr:hypothetical protein FisN_15Hh132 [Fistulifera solaris]|eukprot:GAX22973.1 hypothetical protein FisN_15Hh132 [Fistulifera solaris]